MNIKPTWMRIGDNNGMIAPKIVALHVIKTEIWLSVNRYCDESISCNLLHQKVWRNKKLTQIFTSRALLEWNRICVDAVFVCHVYRQWFARSDQATLIIQIFPIVERTHHFNQRQSSNSRCIPIKCWHPINRTYKCKCYDEPLVETTEILSPDVIAYKLLDSDVIFLQNCIKLSVQVR